MEISQINNKNTLKEIAMHFLIHLVANGVVKLAFPQLSFWKMAATNLVDLDHFIAPGYNAYDPSEVENPFKTHQNINFPLHHASSGTALIALAFAVDEPSFAVGFMTHYALDLIDDLWLSHRAEKLEKAPRRVALKL